MQIQHWHPKQKDDSQRATTLARLYRTCISLLRKA